MFGSEYEQLFAQGSGHSSTMNLNTVRNHWMTYCMKRHQCPNLTPAAVWNGLGVFCGDDSLTSGILETTSVKVASWFGMKYESNIVKRGARGVNFLARYYSDQVWFGALDSICDLKRTLSKFHLTVHMPSNISPVIKLLEKSRSFYLTDKNTPIIGDFVRRVFEIRSNGDPELMRRIGIEMEIEPEDFDKTIHTWWSQYSTVVQYPNEDTNGWMEAEVEHQLPKANCTPLLQYLRDCQSVPDLLSIPIVQEQCEPAPKSSAVCDGDIHNPTTTVTSSTTSSNATDTAGQLSVQHKSLGTIGTVVPDRTSRNLRPAYSKSNNNSASSVHSRPGNKHDSLSSTRVASTTTSSSLSAVATTGNPFGASNGYSSSLSRSNTTAAKPPVIFSESFSSADGTKTTTTTTTTTTTGRTTTTGGGRAKSSGHPTSTSRASSSKPPSITTINPFSALAEVPGPFSTKRELEDGELSYSTDIAPKALNSPLTQPATPVASVMATTKGTLAMEAAVIAPKVGAVTTIE